MCLWFDSEVQTRMFQMMTSFFFFSFVHLKDFPWLKCANSVDTIPRPVPLIAQP